MNGFGYMLEEGATLAQLAYYMLDAHGRDGLSMEERLALKSYDLAKYDAEIAEREAELVKVRAMTTEQAESEIAAMNARYLERETVRRAEKREQAKPFWLMKSKVETWKVPAALENLKKSMLDQIRENMEWEGFLDDKPIEASNTDPGHYIKRQIHYHEQLVQNAVEQREAHVTEVREHNAFVVALLETLPIPKPLRPPPKR